MQFIPFTIKKSTSSFLHMLPFTRPQQLFSAPIAVTFLGLHRRTKHSGSALTCGVREMAFIMSKIKISAGKAECVLGGIRRWVHAVAQPAPLGTAIAPSIYPTSPPLVFPENQNEGSKRDAEFPNLPFFGGSMELMAVPKKKVSRHKRGIRNGPKALKPVPVIIRCKVCGRVKLPHFFCCSGIKQNPGDQHD